MPPSSKDTSGATAVMQDEVIVMEQRLQQLRTTMGAERERRTAAQNSNPSGSQWRSARTDVPTGKYASHALANKPPPRKRRDDAGGEAAAMGRTGNRFGLVQPASERGDSAGAASGLMHARDTTAAGNGIAALRASAGTSTVFTHEGDELADTRPAGEWQPSFSLPDESSELYDILMAPEEPAYSASSGGGGSLLHGTFDEAAEKAAFQAAVGQWRGGGGGGGGGVQAQAQVGGGSGGRGTGTGTGTGGSLLQGAFDEEAEKLAFQAAVAEWRGEPPPAPRARVQPAPPRAPPSLTLAQKVGAINTELGLPEQPVSEAIAQANAIVGLQPSGTLLEQVAALLHELGLQPAAPLATETAAQPAQSHAVMAVQTSAKPNYFALLQEQKRKDGLL